MTKTTEALAREAGIDDQMEVVRTVDYGPAPFIGAPGIWGVTTFRRSMQMEDLARFEDLVRADERERLATEATEAAKSSADEVARLRSTNIWHNFSEVVPILKAAQAGKWQWFENTQCKYIELRIDMRDLGCLIMDRDRERITPDMLAKQWSTGQAAVRKPQEGGV